MTADAGVLGLGADRHGNAMLVTASDAPTGTTQLVPLDGAGTELVIVGKPNRGLSLLLRSFRAKAGKARVFEVEPRDLWSDVAGTTWTFDDKTEVRRARVVRTFAKEGYLTVEVRSEDAVGNETFQWGLIRVRDDIPPKADYVRLERSETEDGSAYYYVSYLVHGVSYISAEVTGRGEKYYGDTAFLPPEDGAPGYLDIGEIEKPGRYQVKVEFRDIGGNTTRRSFTARVR